MKRNNVVRLLSLLCIGIVLYGIYLPVRAIAQIELDKRLIAAIQQRNTPAVHDVLVQGADANARTTVSDLTFREVVELFWTRKGKVSGASALFLALDQRTLRENGENSDVIVDSIVHELLIHGARVEERGDQGTTPLMWAAHKSDLPTVRMLLACGASVNARNDHEVPVLMYAVGSLDDTVVQQLLASGADPNATIKNQIKPEDYIGCTAWAPEEIKRRTERILLLLSQARKVPNIP